MVDALSIATNGLISARTQAADAATGIVKSLSSSSGGHRKSEHGDNGASAQKEDVQHRGGAKVTTPLVQQIAQLKSAEIQFHASAEVFKRISETQDQLLGTLFDDQG